MVAVAAAVAVDPALTSTRSSLFFLFALVLAGLTAAKLYGLYDGDRKPTGHSTVADIPRVFHVLTLSVWLSLAVAALAGAPHPPLLSVAAYWAAGVVGVLSARVAARAVVSRTTAYRQNTVVVGAGVIGQTVARKFLQHPEYGIDVVGFVDRAPKERHDDLADLLVLGTPEDLPEIVRAHDVERVLIAFSGDPHGETLDLIRSLRDLSVQVDVVPRLFEVVDANAEIHAVEGIPLLSVLRSRMPASARIVKRAVDVVVAGCALAVTAPLFLAIAVLIKQDSPGPVFYRQLRMGAGDRPFAMYKFRTMIIDAHEQRASLSHLNGHATVNGDGRLFKISNDPRVTSFGRFLRRYSIDELPQLINVVRGDMSLVGPRPLVLEEDRYVDGWARRRLDLRPGITGAWQVLGRNYIPFHEMVMLDYLYVSSWSLANDFRLMLQTIPIVLRGDADH